MKIRALFSAILSILVPIQQAFAFDMGFADRMVHFRAAPMMEEIMRGSTPMGFKKIHKEDQAILEAAFRTPSAELKTRSFDVGFSAEIGEMGLTIEIREGQLYIGGIPHQINPEISAYGNLRNWAKKYLQRESSKSNSLWEHAIPKAFAAEKKGLTNPNWVPETKQQTLARVWSKSQNIAAPVGMATSASAAGAGFAAIGLAEPTMMLAMSGWGVLALLAIGATYCRAAADGDAKFYKTSSSREYRNCWSAPLSFYGWNARDTLFVQSLQCEGRKVTAVLESNRGSKMTRVFNLEDGRLKSVEENRKVARHHDKEALSTLNFSENMTEQEKKAYDSLKPELDYYQNLCSNPQKLAQFKKDSEAARAKGNIHTDQPQSAD